MRLVLDTNVLVSAVLSPAGNPYSAFRYAVAKGTLIFSEESFLELKTSLGKPRLDRFQDPQKRALFIRRLELFAEWVEIKRELHVCRDPDDDLILETAMEGGADILVTGDKDLLVLHPFENLPILTPSAFLETVAKHSR